MVLSDFPLYAGYLSLHRSVTFPYLCPAVLHLLLVRLEGLVVIQYPELVVLELADG